MQNATAMELLAIIKPPEAYGVGMAIMLLIFLLALYSVKGDPDE